MMGERGYSRARGSQFQLRFSEELHQKLKDAAGRNERPLNAEIIYRLNQSFESEKAISPAIAAIIEQHIDQEVAARLRAIAANINGATA